MDFNAFLFQLSKDPIKVIAPSIDFTSYISIDLSMDNKALQNFDVSSSQSWIKYLNQYLNSRKKSIAFGGYLESRVDSMIKKMNKRGFVLGSLTIKSNEEVH